MSRPLYAPAQAIFPRFRNPRELIRYLRLVSSENSTGDKVKRGGITKVGSGPSLLARQSPSKRYVGERWAFVRRNDREHSDRTRLLSNFVRNRPQGFRSRMADQAVT
jgi:hypothetical protein